MSEKDFDSGTLGGATEVAFCFDTTGSMQPCIANVRAKIEQVCEQLFTEITDLKVGLIAHGDYCDGGNCMHVQPLTTNRGDIFKFIREAPNTQGGDSPECYEWALKEARGLGWSDDKKAGRALVMIGDDEPHKLGETKADPSGYGGGVRTMALPVDDLTVEPTTVSVKVEDNQQQSKIVDIDWRQELDALLEMGVKVYPMQCLFNQGRSDVNRFWSQIAELCNTALVRLDDFNESSEAIAGLAFAAAGSEHFEKYESRLCSTDSEATRVRNAIYRGEAAKYDEIKGSGDGSE